MWWSVAISASQPATAYYTPLTRFWELGFGCLIATLTVRRPHGPHEASGSRPSSRSPSSSSRSSSSTRRACIPERSRGCRAPARGCSYWAGIGGSAKPRHAAARHSPAWLHRRHLVLALPGALRLARASEQLASPLTSWPWRLLELAGTFVTAALSYHFLENPIRRSRRLAGDRVAVFLLLCVCVATTWTASIIVGQFAQLT